MAAQPLIPHLHTALSTLSANPFPTLPSPSTTSKRASVALIIRISPAYDHPAPPNPSPCPSLSAFFSQPWVRHGHASVLFIKRASRPGDRWTSHVALPGGKRDPTDTSDLAAAIRETREEVGLDISAGNPWVLQAGNLPQRVVTTHWGRVPLMVLCPFVFVVMGGRVDLRLQPAEVAEAHWVPVKELLDGRNRTGRREDVSARLARQETGVRRWLYRAIVGRMVFSAVRLRPGESSRCLESAMGRERTTWVQWARGLVKNDAHEPDPPLLLWGLTLGVMADFLDLLPPHDALRNWNYPTFTPWDVRFFIWAMTWTFRRRKWTEIRDIQKRKIPEVAPPVDIVSGQGAAQLEGGIHGLSTGLDTSDERTRQKSGAVSTMLEGYYDIVRKAVAIALLGRASVVVTLMAWIALRRRRRRRRLGDHIK